MSKYATLVASAIATIVLSAGPAMACDPSTQTCLNPPDHQAAKVAVKRSGLICQTRCVSATEWAWVKTNAPEGCWFGTSTEGSRTPKFFGRCGTYCAAPHTNDWGFTEQTTGRHLVFHL